MKSGGKMNLNVLAGEIAGVEAAIELELECAEIEFDENKMWMPEIGRCAKKLKELRKELREKLRAVKARKPTAEQKSSEEVVRKAAEKVKELKKTMKKLSEEIERKEREGEEEEVLVKKEKTKEENRKEIADEMGFRKDGEKKREEEKAERRKTEREEKERLEKKRIEREKPIKVIETNNAKIQKLADALEVNNAKVQELTDKVKSLEHDKLCKENPSEDVHHENGTDHSEASGSTYETKGQICPKPVAVVKSRLFSKLMGFLILGSFLLATSVYMVVEYKDGPVAAVIEPAISKEYADVPIHRINDNIAPMVESLKSSIRECIQKVTRQDLAGKVDDEEKKQKFWLEEERVTLSGRVKVLEDKTSKTNINQENIIEENDSTQQIIEENKAKRELEPKEKLEASVKEKKEAKVLYLKSDEIETAKAALEKIESSMEITAEEKLLIAKKLQAGLRKTRKSNDSILEDSFRDLEKKLALGKNKKDKREWPSFSFGQAHVSFEDEKQIKKGRAKENLDKDQSEAKKTALIEPVIEEKDKLDKIEPCPNLASFSFVKTAKDDKLKSPRKNSTFTSFAFVRSGYVNHYDEAINDLDEAKDLLTGHLQLLKPDIFNARVGKICELELPLPETALTDLRGAVRFKPNIGFKAALTYRRGTQITSMSSKETKDGQGGAKLADQAGPVPDHVLILPHDRVITARPGHHREARSSPLGGQDLQTLNNDEGCNPNDRELNFGPGSVGPLASSLKTGLDFIRGRHVLGESGAFSNVQLNLGRRHDA